jgi:integrase
MRLAHHLVRPRNGVYYYRQRVPIDLQRVLGVRFVQHSLRTRDASVARIYSYTLSLRYAQAFAALRATALPKPPPPHIEDIIARHEGGNTRRFEVEFDPTSLRPTRVKTDGSEQDNRAALEALRLLAQQALPLPPPAVPTAQPAPTNATAKPVGITLTAAIQLYTEAESATLKPNTWSQRQRAFDSFKATLGDNRAVSTITREQAGDWAHVLMTQASGPNRPPMTKRTAANMVSHVAQLFAFLVKRGKLDGPNPVKGVVVLTKKEKNARRAAGFQWEPFELDTLQRVFDPVNLMSVGTEHTRWAMLIGLYTGARVGEVAQLYLRDFVMEGDTPCVRFTTDSDGQTVKTEASTRLVPLHPDLLDLGLWQRVEKLRKAGEERLFPGMRIDSAADTGNAISKGFGNYLGRIKVGPRRANGTVGFHSLRKTVIQTLQACGLSAERRRAFVGHEQGDADVHQMDYMRPWTAQELASLFPGLTWGTWLRKADLVPLLAPCDARLPPEPQKRRLRKAK